MKMSVKFYERSFSDYSSKEAYLSTCRWAAENVVKREVEIGETFIKITKVKDADSPTFKLELYATLDSSEVTSGFCDRCKEFHSLFYMNQQYNCDACNYTAFKKQMELKLKIKKEYRAKLITGYMNTNVEE